MQTTHLVTVTAIIMVIASTGAGYYLLQGSAVPKPVEAPKPTLSSLSTPNRSHTPLREERRDQLANPEPQQLTRLTETLAALEARLRDLEAAASKQAQEQAVARQDAAAAHQGTEKTKAKKLAEADFGQWLDAVLGTEGFDRDATRGTMEHMEKSLAEAPEAHLADLQCSAEFCRASFVPEDGHPPNMVQVMGAAPFIESGFTLTEPDGQVRFYFTQSGQSLRELRSEAQESALWDMPPQ
jgi:hypothetical protein